MKVRIWSVKLIAFIVCVLLYIRITRKITHTISASNQVMVHVDSILSETTQQTITSFIQEKKDEIPTFYALSELLVHSFPCIQSVEFNQDASGIVHSDIQGAFPLLMINQSLVLTHNGSLVPKDIFAHCITQSLPEIIVRSLSFSSNLLSSINALPQKVFEHYDISWLCDEEMIMRDKQNSNFALVCNIHSLPNEQMLQTCEVIKNELLKNKTKKNVLSRWFADIRFKNQIIVSSDDGGHQYG